MNNIFPEKRSHSEYKKATYLTEWPMLKEKWPSAVCNNNQRRTCNVTIKPPDIQRWEDVKIFSRFGYMTFLIVDACNEVRNCCRCVTDQLQATASATGSRCLRATNTLCFPSINMPGEIIQEDKRSSPLLLITVGSQLFPRPFRCIRAPLKMKRKLYIMLAILIFLDAYHACW